MTEIVNDIFTAFNQKNRIYNHNANDFIITECLNKAIYDGNSDFLQYIVEIYPVSAEELQGFLLQTIPVHSVQKGHINILRWFMSWNYLKGFPFEFSFGYAITSNQVNVLIWFMENCGYDIIREILAKYDYANINLILEYSYNNPECYVRLLNKIVDVYNFDIRMITQIGLKYVMYNGSILIANWIVSKFGNDVFFDPNRKLLKSAQEGRNVGEMVSWLKIKNTEITIHYRRINIRK